jgi:hypothetical protein
MWMHRIHVRKYAPDAGHDCLKKAAKAIDAKLFAKALETD